jgi:hypothetical protein
MQLKQSTVLENLKTRIDRLAKEGFFGILKITFVKGEISVVKQEALFKPEEV